MVPIGGTDNLKKLLEQTSSDCKAAVQKLISTIASQTGTEASHTDPLKLFNALTSQTGGGGVYVDVPAEHMNDYVPTAARTTQPAGGRGCHGFLEHPPDLNASVLFSSKELSTLTLVSLRD